MSQPAVLLLAVLLLSSFGCASVDSLITRANVAERLGEADEKMIERACELAARNVTTPDQVLQLAGLCAKGMADYDQFRVDWDALSRAIEEEKGPAVIEPLVLKIEADELALVRDLVLLQEV